MITIYESKASFLKLILNNSLHSNIYFEDFLYDNEKDPAQKNNLIKSKEYNGVKTEMKNLLLEQIEKIEGKRPKILPCIYAKKK